MPGVLLIQGTAKTVTLRNSKEDKITKEEVFEGLVVPDVKLYSFVDDSLMGEERVDCEGLLNEPNCYRSDNPWSNLYRPKVCTGLNCCRCIFFGLNAEKRLKWWQQKRKENENGK